MSIEVREENPLSDISATLIKALSAELGALYNTDGSAAFKPNDVLVEKSAFVVAYRDGLPVGCGALRPYEVGKTAEIKRMFVIKEARGLGISRKILEKLEALAAKFQYERIILETGDLQSEAIGLYESSGYARMACYGEYVNTAYSICYEKTISAK